LGAVRRHRQCGAEQLSGMTEAQIVRRVGRVAKILGVPLGAPCEMLPVEGKIARAAVVAGNPKVNSRAFEGITPFFCSAVSATPEEDVRRYVDLAFAAMAGRFSAQDPFVIAIVGDAASAERGVAGLRARIAAVSGIAAWWREERLVIVGADF